MVLHQAGQRALHTTNELVKPQQEVQKSVYDLENNIQ